MGLKGWSLWARMTVLFGLFTVPLGVLLTFLVSAYDKDIDFNAVEIKGYRYLGPLTEIIRVATSVVSRSTPSEIPDRVFDDLLHQGTAWSSKVGNISLGELSGQLKQKWDKSKNADNKDQLLREIEAEAFRIQGMVSEKSNLILDPVLETYLLIDGILLALPQNFSRIRGLSALRTAESGSETQAAIEVLLNAAIDGDLARMAKGVQVVASPERIGAGQDFPWAKELESKMAQLQRHWALVASDLRKPLMEERERGQRDIQNLEQAAHELWTVGYPALGELLERRLSEHSRMKTRAIIQSVFAFCFLLLVAFSIVRNLVSQFARNAREIGSEVRVVRSSTATIGQTASDLAQVATQQAAAIQQTVASMEEMSSMISQTSRSAGECQFTAEKGRNEAQAGRNVIDKMNTAMGEIRPSITRLESVIGVIEQIQSKTKIINDIVMETRLLSFNASIEAARAGAQGKGFAVVAEEVGKLASMSGKAADEIRSLLAESIKDVQGIVKETKVKIGLGIEISQDAGKRFIGLGEAIDGIVTSVSNIASATREQESGIKQASLAITELSGLTDKCSASADALSHEIVKLHKTSEQTAFAVSVLQGIVWGQGSIKTSQEVEIGKKAGKSLNLKHVPIGKKTFKSLKKVLPISKKSQDSFGGDSSSNDILSPPIFDPVRIPIIENGSGADDISAKKGDISRPKRGANVWKKRAS